MLMTPGGTFDETVGKELTGSVELALVRAGQHEYPAITGMHIVQVGKHHKVVAVDPALTHLVTGALKAVVFAGAVQRHYLGV